MPRATFGLDRIIVEHRSLGPTHPFTCDLPKPISVNDMFGQSPGRQKYPSKRYAEWTEHATIRLKASRPPKFPGRVWIAITFEDAGRSDLDNKPKGVLDLLVREGVIKDDSRDYIREVRLAWGNITGCRVEIRPYGFNETGIAA